MRISGGAFDQLFSVLEFDASDDLHQLVRTVHPLRWQPRSCYLRPGLGANVVEQGVRVPSGRSGTGQKNALLRRALKGVKVQGVGGSIRFTDASGKCGTQR